MRREGDLVVLVYAGRLTLDNAKVVRAQVEEVIRREGRCYLFADMSGLTGMAPEARHFFSAWGSGPGHHMSGAAIYGASFAMRVLTTLVLKAIRFLGNSTLELVFVADEAAARRWLTARRATDEAARCGP
jgi:hypothetical protein